MKTRALKNYSASVGCEAYDIDFNSDAEIIELGKLTVGAPIDRRLFRYFVSVIGEEYLPSGPPPACPARIPTLLQIAIVQAIRY